MVTRIVQRFTDDKKSWRYVASQKKYLVSNHFIKAYVDEPAAVGEGGNLATTVEEQAEKVSKSVSRPTKKRKRADLYKAVRKIVQVLQAEKQEQKQALEDKASEDVASKTVVAIDAAKAVGEEGLIVTFYGLEKDTVEESIFDQPVKRIKRSRKERNPEEDEQLKLIDEGQSAQVMGFIEAAIPHAPLALVREVTSGAEGILERGMTEANLLSSMIVGKGKKLPLDREIEPAKSKHKESSRS